MSILVIGLLVFLGMHSVQIFCPRLRAWAVRRHGLRPWMGLHTVISFVGLALVVHGYGLARLQPQLLYVPPTGLRHLALLLMLPVFPLLFATYFPGRIQRATRHPMLLATLLWAAAHLLANGNRADVLLFGGFLAWACADLASLARRPPKAIPMLKPSRINDAVSLAGGLAVYALALLGLHQWLFGVSPL